MLIAFVHTGKAFMPEAVAYTRFFSEHDIRTVVTTPGEADKLERDVDWYFLGTDRSAPKKGTLRIHEYTSASMPPYGYWKDWCKHLVNAKPDYRIFLNDYVKKRLHFTDNIPFGLRDMGIPADWLQEPAAGVEKKHDFIYIGDTAQQRRPDLFLGPFAGGRLKNRNILVVSRNYEGLQQAYQAYPNIVFTGPLDHGAMREHILSARFALNYIPDRMPFNRQTATKLLEYAACKIPIISTRYQWVAHFREQYGGDFFFIERDLSNLDWDALNAYPYRFPDLSRWTWEHQVRHSGVLEFLQSRFPRLRF